MPFINLHPSIVQSGHSLFYKGKLLRWSVYLNNWKANSKPIFMVHFLQHTPLEYVSSHMHCNRWRGWEQVVSLRILWKQDKAYCHLRKQERSKMASRQKASIPQLLHSLPRASPLREDRGVMQNKACIRSCIYYHCTVLFYSKRLYKTPQGKVQHKIFITKESKGGKRPIGIHSANTVFQTR